MWTGQQQPLETDGLVEKSDEEEAKGVMKELNATQLSKTRTCLQEKWYGWTEGATAIGIPTVVSPNVRQTESGSTNVLDCVSVTTARHSDVSYCADGRR